MTTVLGMELINKDKNKNDEEATATTVDETVCIDDGTDDEEDNNNKCLNDEQLILAKQFISQHEIYDKGELLFIEDADDFWAKLAKLRKTHDRKMKRKTPKSKVYAQLGKVAKGDPKELSEAKLKDLIEPLTEKDAPFDDDQILGFIKLFDSFIAMFDEIESAGCIPLRTNWTQHVETAFQIFCGCMLSAGTLDKKLFDVMMAMRKLGWFDLETLAGVAIEFQRKSENLFLCVGFNYWTGGPANIIGAAKHVM